MFMLIVSLRLDLDPSQPNGQANAARELHREWEMNLTAPMDRASKLSMPPEMRCRRLDQCHRGGIECPKTVYATWKQ